MQLRPMTTADLDPLLVLNNDNVPAVSELTHAELARLLELSWIALVAEVGGAVAGFCMVLPRGVDYASPNYRWFSDHIGELGHDDFAYLDRIAIGAGARRRGVARAMYAAVVDAVASEAPMLCCEVNVRPRNDASLALHAELGFREVGQQDTYGDTRVSLLVLDLA